MSTILAIDDDVTALSTLAMTLESSGFEVRRSSSVSHARSTLDEVDPDLIVLEIDSDDGTGWDLLRDITRYHGPPTIVVTRRGREEEIVEALSIGAVDVLPKPFRSNELVARIRSRLAPPPSVPRIPDQPSMHRPVEEPVFMAQADEASLLTGTGGPPVDTPINDENLPLGQRLRTTRQQRKLTLVQVNLETKVPIWYLQALEEEKFSLLPRGPVAADMLRTYASYLRLDANHALADLRSHHDTTPFHPSQRLGGAPLRREISPWMPITIAIILALVIGSVAFWYFGHDEVRALGTNLYNVVSRIPMPHLPFTSPALPTTTPLPTQTAIP